MLFLNEIPQQAYNPFNPSILSTVEMPCASRSYVSGISDAAIAAYWPSPRKYTPKSFPGPHYHRLQSVVAELRALKFPGAARVFHKERLAVAERLMAEMAALYERRGCEGYSMACLQMRERHSAALCPEGAGLVAALIWVKGQAKHVAHRRVFGRCLPGGQCSAHKDARAVFHNGSYRGPCAEEPTYTEAFEALVLAEMPAAIAEKEAADAAAVTAEALRRIEAEADAAEKQRVEAARITAEARRRIKQAAEKAAEEATIQLEMARLLSTDETVAARIQLRGAELSGLF